MRITPFESNVIKSKAFEVWGDDISIILFGSRVDDEKKGGDIDLYIEIPKSMSPKVIMKKKALFLTLLQLNLGNQKIDLVIKTHNSPINQIMNTAKQTGIAL